MSPLPWELTRRLRPQSTPLALPQALFSPISIASEALGLFILLEPEELQRPREWGEVTAICARSSLEPSSVPSSP